jgi:hypothetical protein
MCRPRHRHRAASRRPGIDIELPLYLTCRRLALPCAEGEIDTDDSAPIILQPPINFVSGTDEPRSPNWASDSCDIVARVVSGRRRFGIANAT